MCCTASNRPNYCNRVYIIHVQANDNTETHDVFCCKCNTKHNNYTVHTKQIQKEQHSQNTTVILYYSVNVSDLVNRPAYVKNK